MGDIFNKIIEENCCQLRIDTPLQIKEAHKTLNRKKKTESNSPKHIILKIWSKERVLKAARQKSISYT